MAFERRRHVAGAKALFKVRPPLGKLVLSFFVKAQERDRLVSVALSADCVRVELVEALEGGPRRLARSSIRPAVAFLPFAALVRPDEQTEALNQPVVSGTAICLADIFGDASRLCRAQQRQTCRLDMRVATDDAVERVAGSSAPSGQEEAARRDILLAIQGLE